MAQTDDVSDGGMSTDGGVLADSGSSLTDGGVFADSGSSLN